MVRKTNFLSISVLISEIATFMSKKKSSLWISLKMLHNNSKSQFISMWLPRIVTFMSKKKMLYEFLQKCSKQHKGLVYQYVGGSLFGEKLFLLIFTPFYWFDQKKLFKQIQIFLRIFPISNMVRKTTFWVFQRSFLIVSLLCLKRENFSLNFTKNASKQQKDIV